MNTVLKAVYIDDDQRDIAMFREHASTIPNFVLCAAFHDLDLAVEYLLQNEVDLIFSDIVINEERDGFWLAEQVAHTNASIIFVSGHSEYMQRAFEICALDYVLKPVWGQTLQHVVGKYRNVKRKFNNIAQIRAAREQYTQTKTYPDNIFINVVGEVHLVPLSEVLYFAASGTYTQVFLNNGNSIMSSKTLRVYAQAIEGHPDFVRTHRSYLVNRRKVKKLNREVGKFSVTMTNGDTLAVSQKKKAEIFSAITKPIGL